MNNEVKIINGNDLGQAIVEWVNAVLEIEYLIHIFGFKFYKAELSSESKFDENYDKSKRIHKAYHNILSMLENGYVCNIFNDYEKSTVFFEFYVPPKNLYFYDGFVQKLLLDACLKLTYQYENYNKKGAYCYALSPSYKFLTKSGNLVHDSNDFLKADLESIVNNELYNSIQSLPSDIKEKGTMMTEVYLYLYCIENTIRLFIEKVCKEIFGDNYFDKIKISAKISTGVHNRKTNAEKNKWLSLRGNSDLYYIDFKDLGELIVNNWNLFEKYFPGQNWIKHKLDELGNIRNVVAHNNIIGEHEKEILRINYHSILKQING